ncbi:MAG: hypothetical protein SVK54_07895 [candidate division WOR-3 bacterium]|nr:hypothetical protein [candidate division WOR-3 bacterium]
MINYNKTIWINENEFIVNCEFHRDNMYHVEEYLVNIETEEVERTHTWAYYQRKTSDLVDNDVVSPDERYVWGVNDNNQLTRVDRTLDEIDYYDVEVHGELDVDWDSLYVFCIQSQSNALLINTNTGGLRYLDTSSVLLDKYKIEHFYDVTCVTLNNRITWGVDVLLNDMHSDTDLRSIVYFNNELNLDSCIVAWGVYGEPSTNAQNYFHPVDTTNNELAEFELYDSEFNYMKTISF